MNYTIEQTRIKKSKIIQRTIIQNSHHRFMNYTIEQSSKLASKITQSRDIQDNRHRFKNHTIEQSFKARVEKWRITRSGNIKKRSVAVSPERRAFFIQTSICLQSQPRSGVFPSGSVVDRRAHTRCAPPSYMVILPQWAL